MSESETALLRKELAKVVAENRDWQMRVTRFEAAFVKREEMLEVEIDRLRLEIAERDRRLARYENPNASSSTDSLYNEERAAFRKRMENEGEPGPASCRDTDPHEGARHGQAAHKGPTASNDDPPSSFRLPMLDILIIWWPIASYSATLSSAMLRSPSQVLSFTAK